MFFNKCKNDVFSLTVYAITIKTLKRQGMLFFKSGNACDSLQIKTTQASFISTGSIPIGMDKYNKKIMILTIRDPDLFRVEN
jgi:hypothetical protein